MLRFLGLLAALLLSTGLSLSPALAGSHCLVSNETTCRLKVDKQGFRIQVDERGQIVVVFGNSPAEIERGESYVVVQEDLDRLESNQIFTPNESAQIRAELTNYDGTAYMIPDSEELKAALNLPQAATVAPHDYMDLIQVHMQVVLSFSAFTSGYLGELMGVAVLEPAPVAPAPAPVAASPTPAPTPAPEPEPIEENPSVVVPYEVHGEVPAATPVAPTPQPQSQPTPIRN